MSVKFHIKLADGAELVGSVQGDGGFVGDGSLARPNRRAMSMTSLSNLDDWFRYHSPHDGQVERYVELRNAANAFAETIVRLTPPSADRAEAIRKVLEAAIIVYAAGEGR